MVALESALAARELTRHSCLRQDLNLSYIELNLLIPKLLLHCDGQRLREELTSTTPKLSKVLCATLEPFVYTRTQEQ